MMTKVFVLAKNDEDYQRITSLLKENASFSEMSVSGRISSLDETEEILADDEENLIIGSAAGLNSCHATGLPDPPDLLCLNDLSRRAHGGKEAAGVVREMIHYNYMQKYSVSSYADLVHISDTYLCRIFRNMTGQSVGDYILRVRMEKAAALLRSTPLIVKEIGNSVGYSNFSYFCKRFKAYFGISPNDYRMRFRQQSTTEKKENGGN